MVAGRYVGHHARNGAVVILTDEGVRVGAGLKRMPEADRWSADGWYDLKGLPWSLKPVQRDLPMPAVDDAASAAGLPPMVPRPEIKEAQRRGFYVKRTDVAKYGATVGCKACEAAVRGAPAPPGVAHTEACRRRIMEKVEADDEERVALGKAARARALRAFGSDRFAAVIEAHYRDAGVAA